MIGWRRIFCAACVVVLLCQVSHAIEGLDIGAEGRLMGDSNVGNAVRSQDEEGSFRSLGNLKLSYNRPLGELSKLQLWLRAGGEYFTNIEDLSNLFAQGRADYELAMSNGFAAPVFTLLAEVTGVDVKSDIRDSVNFRLGVEMRSQLSPTLTVGGGVHGIYNNADSDVFTTKDLEVFTHAGYSLLKDGTLYGNFTYQYGDVTSTSSPTLAIINASKAITPDDAFGGLAANQLAYKVVANTFMLTLGYRHSFSERLALDASLRGIYSIATANADLTYKRYQAIVQLNFKL
jgi:hypothetical protein